MDNQTPKPVKERDNLDLLELVCQLHSRALNFPSKEMHDSYMEARNELELRLTPPAHTEVTVNNAGVIAVNIAGNIIPKLTENEQAFFIAGFQECVKYFNFQPSTEVTDTRVWVEVPVIERLPTKEGPVRAIHVNSQATLGLWFKDENSFKNKETGEYEFTHWLERKSLPVQSPTDTGFSVFKEISKSLKSTGNKKYGIPKTTHADTPKGYTVEDMEKAFPLHDALKYLIIATEILLHKKDYDGPDYEEMEHSIKSATAFLNSLKHI